MADKTLQEIKDRLNVAEVISGYIEVKKAGASFKAVCPFHNEKSPSLHISPHKQIWHCFGCGEGGDVFSFVQKYENMEFRDVVKILADKAGVKLPEYKPKDKGAEDEADRLTRINNYAAKFYHQLLTKDARGKQALEYLQKRGLNAATIEQWQVGFAPEEFHVLEKALAQNKVGLNDLVKAGVSSKNERGQIYDRFRGRITFPIHNYVGDVVGFSARIMPGIDKGAKYINSPETPIYNKSKILFGLHFAKNAIRKADEVIIVEGQMDCIAAHQAGFATVVASSGTALTLEQLELVGRFTKNLKFCFDADIAGLNATRRAVGLYLGKDFTIKVVNLNGVKDVGELLEKNPATFRDNFTEAIKQAPLFLDFYISKLFEGFNPNSIEQKKKVAKEVLPLVKQLSDPLEQGHYITMLAERFSTTEQILKDALGQVKAKKPVAGPAQPVKIAAAVKVSEAEKEVLGAVLKYPDLLAEIADEANPLDFENKEAQELARNIFAGADTSQSALAKEALFMVELALEELGQNIEAHKRQLYKSFALLKLNSLKKQQKILTTKIKQAEDNKAKQDLVDLNQKFAALAKKRLRYENLL